MYDTHLHFNSVNLDSMLLICSIWVTKTQPCMPSHHWMTSCQSLATKQSHRLHSSAETSTSLLTKAARSGWIIGGTESCGFEKWITEYSNFRNMLRWMNEFFLKIWTTLWLFNLWIKFFIRDLMLIFFLDLPQHSVYHSYVLLGHLRRWKKWCSSQRR